MYSPSTKDLHLVCVKLLLDSTKCQEATKPGSFMDISSNDIGILSKIQPVSHLMLSFTPHFRVHLIQVKFHFQYLNCSFLQKNSPRKCEESGSNIFCTSANLLQISSTHLFRLSFPLENGFFQGSDVFLLKGKDLGAR